MTETKHFYKVTGWGTELEFYSGLSKAEVEDGFSDLDPDNGEVLIGHVLVLSDQITVHEASLEHPEITWGSKGLVRPLLLKWYWEIELDSEFDPKLLSFSDSVLIYGDTEFEADEAVTKGEDEPYEV